MKHEKSILLILAASLLLVGTVYVYNLNQLLKKYNNDIRDLETTQQELLERIGAIERIQYDPVGQLLFHTP